MSDISYKLAIALSGDAETYFGHMETFFTLSAVNADVFLDFKGRSVPSITVNGTRVPHAQDIFKAHRIHLPAEFLKVGDNTVVVEFEAEYVSDCEGMQKFVDSSDKGVYLYSNAEPAHAHKWFPCFDQPDLKATYELVVFAPGEWRVVATAKSVEGAKKITCTEAMVKTYGGKLYGVYQFAKSAKISTYLFCVVAGPYAVFEPSQEMADPKIPMKLFCRQSIKHFVEEVKEDWFRVTKNGIHFYEEIFSTPYPFDKFDQVFCPDYRMGAMENVGLVTYNDTYISRGEKATRVRTENIYNTILHEISHMWFGNLVTMKWWDDLWLNESFANMISYMCMDEGKGLEDITLAWNIFLG